MQKRAAEWDAKAAEYQHALKDAPAQRADVVAEIAALKRPAPVEVAAACTAVISYPHALALPSLMVTVRRCFTPGV